ncbi:MAG TPA: NUDIX hydrolase [Candidatus Acidoferrum sp.]|nr:NUDIX hydrolase [Candidatus Acidoferrum sp.]
MLKTIPSNAVLIPDNAKKVFAGVIFDVYQWQQELFDGSKTTFEMLKRPDTVAAICVVEDKILLLNDRQSHRDQQVKFPGGRGDPADLSAGDAARREILEETGYEFVNWRLVSVRQPFSKIEWFVHYFIAWGETKKQAPHLDAGEKNTISFLTFDELKRLVTIAPADSYIGSAKDIFEQSDSLDKLLALPEYIGSPVDR